MSTTPEESRTKVQQILEDELAQVDSPEKAEDIVGRVEAMATGVTEQEAADVAAKSPDAAADAVEHAAEVAPPAHPDKTAAVLAETAAQTVAPTPEASAVLEGAREAMGTAPAPAPPRPAAERGRSLLREAILRRMGPLQAFDAQLFLAINCLPHPRWMNPLANAVSILTLGGWIWVFGVLGAYLLRVRKSWEAVETLLPSVVLATWIVEFPIKSYFRRQRPFITIVRALVVGKKPGSWSFPSGHTASSFACAWVLSTIWRRRSPIFFAIASTVGLSRVYVGAHYPGDVASGALLGVGLSEVFRRGVRRLLYRKK